MQQALSVLAVVTCLVVVAATLVPWLPSKAGIVRIAEFPRVQLLVLGLAGIVGLIVLADIARRPYALALLVATAAAVGLQALRILPFTPLVAVEVPAASRADARNEVSLLLCNVQRSNTDHRRVRELVERMSPDIVLLVEVNARWRESLRAIEAQYPTVLAEPREDFHGLLFMTRLPVHEAAVRHVLFAEVPSVKATLATPAGRVFDFYGLHPAPPLPGQPSTERDVELLRVAAEVARSARPAIVGGDLNDVAWSWTNRRFLAVSRLKDPRVGRGLYATFHADHWFARWPLDHLFHAPQFSLCELRVMPHVGSDHFPIWARLQA